MALLADWDKVNGKRKSFGQGKEMRKTSKCRDRVRMFTSLVLMVKIQLVE